MNLAEIQTKSEDELKQMAHELGLLENGSPFRRQDLVMKVLQAHAEQNGQLVASGILSIVNDGYGFLRQGGSDQRRGVAGTK